jgi:hypothetical protein
VNNRLEAAGEGFMLGGADPSIPNLVPSDVWFHGNHVTRPLSWRDSGWTVKNLFELKNARRVRVEGNLFEHNWRDGQAGSAILFTPRNQDGTAPWSVIEDVTFRYNVVRHVAAGFNVLGHDSQNRSEMTRRVEIAHNLLYDVDGPRWGGNGEFVKVGEGVEGLVVEHNTVFHTGNMISAYGGSDAHPRPMAGFVFRRNILRHNSFGVHGSGQAVGNGTLSSYFPGAMFEGNLIAGGTARNYPAGNSFPPADEFERMFADPDAGDFRFVGRLPSGDLGTKPGADIEEVTRAWRAAQAGVRVRSPRMPPPEWELDRGDAVRRKQGS